MICYNDVKMWTVHTKDSEYNQKRGEHKKVKRPGETEEVHVSEVHGYDVGDRYEIRQFAAER